MSDTIILLSDREKVRERPGMYIGDTSKLGLATIVREVIDNAFDEFVNYDDKTKPVIVTLHTDDSVSVRDYGRGISPNESKKHPGHIEERLAFTRIGAGGKMRSNRKQNNSQFSAGLHGTGAAATNFMSEYFDVTIFKPDYIYHDRFENGGLPVVELKNNKLPKHKNETGETGTLVHFKPDASVMRQTRISASTLRTYFSQMQYLHEGITIIFDNQRDDEYITYHAENGLLDFVTKLTDTEDAKDGAIKPFLITNEETTVILEREIQMKVNIAINVSKKDNARVLAFTNTTYNNLGGTHKDGFYKGFVKLLQHYYNTFKSEIDGKYKTQIPFIQKMNNNKPIDKLIKQKHVESKFYGVIDLKHNDPELQPQTKDRLASDEVTQFMIDTIYNEGMLYFDKQITIIHQVLDYIIKELYENAKDADDSVKLSKKDEKLLVSTKLATARAKKPELAEIFLVEGDSAAGTIKSNRDPNYQAVLPLRGKVLNVQKATLKKAIANTEISTFFAALGAGFGRNYDEDKLKYHKIIIATDQDVDGLHIRVLLLTLIMKFIPDLIRNGHVYFLETPLYVNETKNGDVYTYSQDEQGVFIENNKKSLIRVNRNKGLGELTKDQVVETILTAETRRLVPVEITDEAELERTIEDLMGNNVDARRNYFISE